MYEYRTKRRVEFAETDMAGIVHFANYFRYMEMAEHEFLRCLGLSAHGPIEGQMISWPRVRAECSYKAPAKFEDVLDVHLVVREKRRKSISYDVHFSRPDGTLVAHGTLTAVCATIDPATGGMKSLAIPPSIDEKIEVAPPHKV